MRIVIHDDAGSELEEDAARYEQRQAELGADLLEEATRALVTISEAPRVWPFARRSKTVRRFHLTRFPYTVFYLIHEDELRIVAFAHMRKRPGYWRSRRFI